MKNNTFHFSYQIIDSINSSQEVEFSCGEIFVPFTGKEILESYFFSYEYEKYKPLFVNDSNSKNRDNYNFLKKVSENETFSDTINILMDAVYCVNIALVNPIFYDVLTLVESDVYLLSKISNIEKLVKFPLTMYGPNIHYIAMYTELIKNKVLEDKTILSILFYLYNTTKTIDKELTDELLLKINNKYSLEIPNLSISNKKSIKDAIFKFCELQNPNNCKKGEYSLRIDFKDFNTFIALIKSEYNRNNNHPNIDKNNCFCLTQVNDDYYFSFSGYDDKKYGSLAGKIQTNLEKKFPNKKFIYCEKSDDMLSYGHKDNNNKFNKFENSKKESEQSNLSTEELKKQYACCERKIFACINKTNTQFHQMYIYCKYEPCYRCKPAIEEEKNKYSSFMFFAFIKDKKSFANYLKEKKKNILKQPEYIYTFIQ